MMSKYSGLFFIIHLIKISFLDAYTQSCNASLETVVQVARCPTSNASYAEAARQKNCSSLPLDKTGCGSFQYHCVLSEDLNAAIEVCAPSINIIDYVCAMFSSKFKSIMRVHDQSCGNSKAGCPYSYNSTLAFMYQQCYTKIYDVITTETTPRLNSFTTKGLSKTGLENSEDKSWIAGVVIGAILLIVIIAGISIICWKRNKRNKRKGSKLLQEENLEVPIVETYSDITEDDEEHEVMPEVQPTTPLMDVKGSEFPKEIKPLSPLAGTYKITEEVDASGKENTDELKLEGVFRFAKLVMAIESNLTQIYRDILEMEVPHETVATKVKLSDIYGKLSQEENDILGKAVQFGYDEFKIPLMYKLLRHICFKIPKPTKGWGAPVFPAAEDVSVGDDIERIRHFRNQEFGTISAPVSQKSFDEYWNDIFHICQRLQRYTKKNYLKDLIIIQELLLEEVEKEVLRLTQEMEKEVLRLTPEIQSYTLAKMQLELRDKLQEEAKKEKILKDFKETQNKYPAYHLVKTRELSFESCENSSIKDRACEFARDGFFFEGYGLVTTCFHCGLQKDDWKQDDDIHAEHKKLNETCAFVKYVQLHISKKK